MSVYAAIGLKLLQAPENLSREFGRSERTRGTSILSLKHNLLEAATVRYRLEEIPHPAMKGGKITAKGGEGSKQRPYCDWETPLRWPGRLAALERKKQGERSQNISRTGCGKTSPDGTRQGGQEMLKSESK